MATKTIPFDAAEYFADADAQNELLHDALDSGEPHYIAHALGIIARARGMSEVARQAGVSREALYKALSENGDPKLSTLIGVAKALGLKLSLSPVEASEHSTDHAVSA